MPSFCGLRCARRGATVCCAAPKASTYHQLGRVAQEQRRWAEAEEYYRNDLEISKDFEDWQGVGITFRSIARLWRESGDATIPGMVTHVFGFPRAEAEQLLTKRSTAGRQTPRRLAD